MSTSIAKHIDHTLLSPTSTKDQLKKLCDEAKSFHFASVCVHPIHVKTCVSFGVPVVCTVVGFPLGSNTSEIKKQEAVIAFSQGAKEVDMVINQSAVVQHDWDSVAHDISSVVSAKSDEKHVVKVILETCNLSDDDIVECCKIAAQNGADFVKTSTGFGKAGATLHHVQLMAKACKGTGVQIKASGGIRTYEAAKQYIDAGATRIGASSGVKIVQQEKADGQSTAESETKKRKTQDEAGSY